MSHDTPAPAPAPAEPGRLDAVADGREHAVDERAVALWRVRGAIRGVLLGLVILFGAGLLLAYRPLGPAWSGPGAAAVAVLTVAQLVLGVVWPPYAWRRLRWRLDAAAFHLQRGVLWRAHVTVPRSRVQHTDVTQGPLERLLGLASLVVYTAGTEHSEVRLGGLRHATACAIRDFLIASGAPDAR